MSYDLETKKKKLDSWSKEINKREALTEREREKLDEEKKKVAYLSFTSLPFYFNNHIIKFSCFSCSNLLAIQVLSLSCVFALELIECNSWLCLFVMILAQN